MFWKNRLVVSIAAAGLISAAAVGGVAAASGGGTSAAATVAASEAPAGESGVAARADLASPRIGGGGVAIALHEEGEGPRGRCGQRGHAGGEVAEFLGLEPAELRERLQSGETPAEIAASQGSSGEALIAYLVGEAETRLQTAVDEERLDPGAGR